MQGLHNIHGSFVPNLSASLASRNPTVNAVPSSGLQQLGGSVASGRFSSSNLPVPMPQISHGHSGITDRSSINVAGTPAFNGVSGSIPGIPSSSASASNRNSIPGFGVNPLLGNLGPRISNPAGSIVAGGNIGRNISSGGLAIPSLASRPNLAGNIGSGTLNARGTNRLIGGMLQQAPQMMGMLRNSYTMSGPPIPQSQLQGGNNLLSSMGMLSDGNSNDVSPFDMNDFPLLTARPDSTGGSQGQLGALRKQGLGVSSIAQQNQEFSIQNEDFPALPGYKGVNSDFSMDLHQKEQSHENASVMQSPNFAIGRSTGFPHGGTYTSNRQQQQQHAASVTTAGGVSYAAGDNQDHLHLYGSDMFPSSHGAYHSQSNGPPSIGVRPFSSQNLAPGIGSYDQLIQQYQRPINQAQLRMQQMSTVNQSYRDHSMKSMQGTQASDRFGLLGLLSVMRGGDPNLTSLAMGMDLTTLGLNLLSSPGDLHKTFSSPWSDEPAKGEPEFSIPTCYYSKPPPALKQGHFSKLHTVTLFYIFYSMPKDEAQLFAANELYSRGWFFHRELQLWLIRIGEPLVKTQTYERGSYHYFNPTTWQTIRKDNFVLTYESLEKKPILPKH
ncbi:hypothetical protein AXF42_Ash008045 [Apostasia shenzhenica]|uniref:NOT2/NOT3/NOT5 C-terminal domain-containing protein n=1 Tax=Apostasia shenzhenica TaxID=1088818 RepID=A0A2I0A8F8_9ASPA|nr:hypothetical protein AXF42_Ash008045 [Apostasia shenzhenica]